MDYRRTVRNQTFGRQKLPRTMGSLGQDDFNVEESFQLLVSLYEKFCLLLLLLLVLLSPPHPTPSPLLPSSSRPSWALPTTTTSSSSSPPLLVGLLQARRRVVALEEHLPLAILDEKFLKRFDTTIPFHILAPARARACALTPPPQKGFLLLVYIYMLREGRVGYGQRVQDRKLHTLQISSTRFPSWRPSSNSSSSSGSQHHQPILCRFPRVFCSRGGRGASRRAGQKILETRTTRRREKRRKGREKFQQHQHREKKRKENGGGVILFHNST